MIKKLNKVLLIDDDEVTTFLNSRLISKMGIAEEILTARDGKEASQMLLDTCCAKEVGSCILDLVVVDINMPVMDGFEFLEAYASMHLGCSPKVVLLSSSSDPRDIEKAKEFNLLGIIPKPLMEEALNSLLAEFCQN
ncbi:response regulator [Rufibacter latericius]|uniref:Response regulator n=1 Tax=Rufibacter latericius TaxID=2487040 RepID=A0A3M9MU97_9BACT|nr:response regulator [Rufibacter latericius]RNI29079.1 response regulator [Rufibacter latericius]